MIPKVIHYCWFGGKKKPKSVEYCIDSWRKICPDYKIVEWNESNYDISSNKYMNDAYENSKLGFVPDYARLDIIYKHGGIYLDTDVELIKSFDCILDKPAFIGFENSGDSKWFVNCGQGFGAEPGNEAIRKLRDQYNSLQFIADDGKLNMTASPHYTTSVLQKIGLELINCDQDLGLIFVYSSDVLCPKNYKSGVIRKSKRTISIHHFDGSWIEESVLNSFKHNQKIYNLFGYSIGTRYLYLESILLKYFKIENFYELLKKEKNEVFEKYLYTRDIFNLLFFRQSKGYVHEFCLLDTSIDSDNLGDSIILNYCMKELSKTINAGEYRRIPTHKLPTAADIKILCESKNKILTGTNIVSGNMRNYGLWGIGSHPHIYSGTILMGVGSSSKNMGFDLYSKFLFKRILSKNYIHSTRDTMTRDRLRMIGIENVIYTGCPTMWGLTPELLNSIPTGKSESVIFTLTDYYSDFNNDKILIEKLISNYCNVYFWPQGAKDLEYFNSLDIKDGDSIIIIGRSLEEFIQILKSTEIDYVGTRLHAGILAMNMKKRTLIISIDNRADEISKDTGLTVLPRNRISLELENYIFSQLKQEINLPWNDIQLFLDQF